MALQLGAVYPMKYTHGFVMFYFAEVVLSFWELRLMWHSLPTYDRDNASNSIDLFIKYDQFWRNFLAIVQKVRVF